MEDVLSGGIDVFVQKNWEKRQQERQMLQQTDGGWGRNDDAKKRERDRKAKIEWRVDRVLGSIEKLSIYPWIISQYGQLVPEACWKCVNTVIQQTENYSSPHRGAPEE